MENEVIFFLTVCNGYITDKHCGQIDADLYGTEYYGQDRIPLTQDAYERIQPWQPVNHYTPDWQRKSDVQLIDEGLIPMPAGYIREGDTLRKMTQAERIIAGLDPVPPGEKIQDGILVAMSLEDKLAAGIISDTEYTDIKTSEATAELNRRLSDLQTAEALAMTEVDEDYAAERKAKLTALLAVRKQPGWPLNPVWPIE